MPKRQNGEKKQWDYHSLFFGVPLYGIDVLVMVGCKTKEDVSNVFKKQRVQQKTVEKWMKDPSLDWLLKQQAGSLIHEGELAIIYHFQDWEDDDKHLEWLVHEVSHMVDSIAEYKNFVKETEARAYLSEYLFKTIRNNLR